MNYQIIHKKRLNDDHEAVTCSTCGSTIPFRSRYIVIEEKKGLRITNTAYCTKCYELIEGRKKDDRQ